MKGGEMKRWVFVSSAIAAAWLSGCSILETELRKASFEYASSENTIDITVHNEGSTLILLPALKCVFFLDRRVAEGWQGVAYDLPCTMEGLPPIEIQPGTSYAFQQDVRGLAGEYRINLPLRDTHGLLPSVMRVSSGFIIGE
jgi:hypothetical protein